MLKKIVIKHHFQELLYNIYFFKRGLLVVPSLSEQEN